MSKSNMLLGLAKGKVGDLVFYRDGGEQRTRTRVVPKNPRSSAQMGQRIRLANVPAFYRTMQEIMKDSFSNRPSNQSGYNAFAKGAIEVSPFLTKEMALASSVLPAPYVVSRGVIGSIPCENASTGSGRQPKLPLVMPTEPPTTIGQISQLILGQYTHLQAGDILTFVGVTFFVEEYSATLDIHRATSSFAQITLDATSTETFADGTFVFDSDGLSMKVRSASENTASAIIASRKLADGTLQTSTATLVLDNVATTLYENYRTEEALTEAIDSYGRGEESSLR